MTGTRRSDHCKSQITCSYSYFNLVDIIRPIILLKSKNTHRPNSR